MGYVVDSLATYITSALGVEDEHTSLPVARSEIGRVPPEPFRWPAAKLTAWAAQTPPTRVIRTVTRITSDTLMVCSSTRVDVLVQQSPRKWTHARICST